MLAKQRLLAKLKQNDKLINSNLDMEPFEVLCDMLKENDDTKYPLIGGVPQPIKVYEHMNRTPTAVNWEVDGNNVVSLSGRPLLHFERSSFPVIDPETLKISRTDLIGQ